MVKAALKSDLPKLAIFGEIIYFFILNDISDNFIKFLQLLIILVCLDRHCVDVSCGIDDFKYVKCVDRYNIVSISAKALKITKFNYRRCKS